MKVQRLIITSKVKVKTLRQNILEFFKLNLFLQCQGVLDNARILYLLNLFISSCKISNLFFCCCYSHCVEMLLSFFLCGFKIIIVN